MASTYLSKTLSGSPTDNNKWTWSAWVKRSKLGTEQPLFYADDGGTSYYTNLRFNDQDEINFQNRFANSNDMYLITNEKYRDTNGWYHIVAVLDTSNSTAADRQIIYVNGTRLSNYRTETTSTLNKGSTINDGYQHRIGRGNNVHGSDYFDGLMSHVHFTDGYVYAASAFGSTDSTTGEWEINTTPSVVYGTNGFFILKDGNSVTDQSGNSNNFTVAGGTLSNTEDCPDNVFAVLNPLQQNNTATTYSNGNTKGTGTSSTSNFSSTPATLAASSGKFYAEYKPNLSTTGSSISGFVNLDTANFNATDYYGGNNNMSAGLYDDAGQIMYSTGTNLGSVGALSNGDIVMLAMDLDNGYLYWGKNGTWFNSANPATSGGTGGLALSNLGSNGTYTFMNGNRKSMGTEWNFGNGFFGTTAVATNSGNGYAGAEGSSIFNYQPPTGYSALSTKGLNE